MTASPAESSRVPERFYLPELDGLRFLAFFFVFFHHVYPAFPPFLPAWSWARSLWGLVCESGVLGVDLFFCLSGFLITRLLLLEVARTGTIAIGRFYLRRLLRIWPLYYFFLGLAIYLGSIGWDGRLGDQTWPYLLMVGNWATAFWHFPYASAALLWSVNLEEQFYLLWPALLRRWTVARIHSLPWLLAGIATFYRLLLVAFEIPHPATWTLTLTRLDSLAAGILVAALADRLQGPRPRLQRLALFAAGFALWMGALALWPVSADPTWGSALFTYPAVAAGAALMLVGTLAPAGTPARWLASPPLVYLGRISYGLYVYHMLVLGLTARCFPSLALHSFGLGLAGLALTVLVATLSYFGLERPFLRLKERFATVRSRPA